MDLRYDCHAAALAGMVDHPQATMRRLGITCRKAIPQSMGDQWWFHDCAGAPATLPPCLSEMVIEERWLFEHLERISGDRPGNPVGELEVPE